MKSQLSRHPIVGLLFLSLFLLPAMAEAADPIRIHDPWVRAAPPTSQVLAAYMVIENTGTMGKTLIGVRSPRFHRIEFHETIHRNGMATMAARDSLVIDAGGKVSLKPNGYHLMLIAPQAPVREGDRIPFTLMFSDGDHENFEAPVRRNSEEGGGMAHGHHGSHH